MKNYMMVQLTTEQAKKWVLGILKNTYTNLNLKCKGLLGVSGRYFYRIDFIGKPKLVSFNKVPKGYQNYINKNKPIWKIPSVFIKRWKRKGMR